MGATRDMTYANIFRRAAEILGGEVELCELLEASPEACESWLTGRAKPPADALLKAVDVLLAHVEGKPIPGK
jgi:hypothetical protein